MQNILSFIITVFSSAVLAADTEKLPINAPFIMSIAADNAGNLYFGSEDDGIFRYVTEGTITQYTIKDGLGDNNGYALAVDKQNRLWVGHLNSGVSVFNGNNWKNYDVINGPIGERIFDIQVCPIDGGIWIATSAGITRYQEQTGEWIDYTRKNGLPEDQCSTLAFLKDGTLIAGTQCSGISIFKREKDGSYQHSKNITAPLWFGEQGSPVPLAPKGTGLPANLINKIIVTEADTVWIATNAGLVKADADFTAIKFIRGKDYADKVKGLYGGAPNVWKRCTDKVFETLLPEDYLTSVALAPDGNLYLGFRQKGAALYHPNTETYELFEKPFKSPAEFVTAVLSTENGGSIAGTYGGGAYRLTGSSQVTKPSNMVFAAAELPKTRRALTTEQLKKLAAELDKQNEILPHVWADYLGEDWKTQGDWVGRYGCKSAVLCAAASPFDHRIQDSPVIDVRACIGPNCKPDDGLRHWVHWLKTGNPKTLYSPLDGYRRQAEWDDHGEVYPMSQNGPDIWIYLNIKEEEEMTWSHFQSSEKWLAALESENHQFRRKGVYRVSMYFFNKDGHENRNRFRDFTLEVYPCKIDFPNSVDDELEFAKRIEKAVCQSRPLAKTRVQHFWGGVHKSFAVMGAGKYVIRLRRNYGFNTIVSSVCTDLAGTWTGGVENPEFPLQLMYGVKVEPAAFPANMTNEQSQAAVELWNKNEIKVGYTGFTKTYREYQTSSYRSAAAATKTDKQNVDCRNVAETLKWRLCQWDAAQRKEFAELMQEAWKRLGEVNPDYVRQQEEFMQQRKDGTWKPPLGRVE